MARIGVFVHLERDPAISLARKLSEELVVAGHDLRLPGPDADAVGLADHAADDHAFGSDLDLVVTFGGDGSMLRAVHHIGRAGVPVLGVDFGQLGYLTHVKPADAGWAIEEFLAGRHQIEERMLVETSGRSGGDQLAPALALNEVVVERAGDANTLRLAVGIDGDFFTTYAVDGLIVASPTGSTAYAFSARGPIIDPTHRALLLTPVSPHMLFDRSLVLAPASEVVVTVDGHRAASVSVDGRRVAMLDDGDSITCTASSSSVRLVTFGRRRFHRVLKEKFGLNDR